jgi:D-alanyl-D-alanine carboxypeptidase (penicillin-binding protein 5/6)
MLEINTTQKVVLKLFIAMLKLVNFLNIELKWVVFSIFTIFMTLTFVELGSKNLDDFMKMTRRKPVLSLSETIPDSVLRLENNFQEAVIVETDPATLPPKKLPKIDKLDLQAKSYLIYDLRNSRELLHHNKNLPLPPASLVKVLSVMYLSQDLNFTDRLKMTLECSQVNGQKVGHKIGEDISVKDLVYASLIYSGADSTCLLSRSGKATSIEGFNEYAKSIGIINSNFTNYIGLDYTNNFTTSEDMLTMTIEFLKREAFKDIVTLKNFKLENGKVIYNTNKMLFSEKNSAGVKTGTTDGANENLIYRYKDDIQDIDILIVILNSADRYSDIKKIINNLKFEN